MPEILVIDDEPNIRRMVGAILSGEGFSVRDAANGAAGVRAPPSASRTQCCSIS